jgi:AcrR family transcriptional regulator
VHNTASVNYHFRDKQNLYIEVWKHRRARRQLYPIDGGVSPTSAGSASWPHRPAAADDRVGRLGHFHRLLRRNSRAPAGSVPRRSHASHIAIICGPCCASC